MHTAISNEFHCPGCRTPAGPAQAYCTGCGIWLAGPAGAELRWIDGELKRVDAARTWLIGRRAALLAALRAELVAVRPEARASAVVQARAQPNEPRRPPEVSARTAARLLLAAGAAVVVIAVIVFTVADWAKIDPLGRCGILLAATAIVLAAPPAVLRRGLNATAESVAAIGLALTVADAFVLERLIRFTTGALTTAAATAAIAGVWAGYGTVVRLRGPRLAAIGLAQAVLPLAIAGLVRLGWPGTPLAGPIAGALVLNSAADLALAAWAERTGHGAEAATSSAAAVAAWIGGVLIVAAGLAAQFGMTAGSGTSGVIWSAATLIAAAVVAVMGPRGRLAMLARPAAAMSGVLLAAGLAMPVAELAPASWELAVAACSSGLVVVVALAVRGEATSAKREEFVALGAAVVLAGTVAAALPAAVAGLFPARWPLSAWSGPVVKYTSTGFSVWPGTRAAAVVLALTALACWLAPAPARVRVWLRAAALSAAVIAVASLPATAHLTGWTALAVPTAAAVTLLAVGAVQSGPGW